MLLSEISLRVEVKWLVYNFFYIHLFDDPASLKVAYLNKIDVPHIFVSIIYH